VLCWLAEQSFDHPAQQVAFRQIGDVGRFDRDDVFGKPGQAAELSSDGTCRRGRSSMSAAMAYLLLYLSYAPWRSTREGDRS